MTSISTSVASLPTLTQTGATIALQAASLYAADLGLPMSIAIVDAHTHLLAFTRHDAAKHSSIETALCMAATSAANRLPTSALSETNTPFASAFSFAASQRLCTLPGGLPILSPAGALLGAIGCSTGTSLQGEDAAAAGRDAVLQFIKLEAEDEARRIEDEREKVLRLWKEKESEVESLRDELDYERYGTGKRRKTSSVGVGRGGSASPRGRESRGLGLCTPPEEGEIGDYLKPSFVGEVRAGGF
ncbi:uncharacterized protein M421DRAFT_304820 [Didymella exigua CBS 183.55]|uniref:DUF336-domain-containing protein n=1 Tax=Didymella exigua CBS 183.55 TaxID=1150837 RepID=A0A6A5RAQ6_9PLEO|nr:uncharacterized protein M421DRAFT_304820 [Didymella exigua CBS 183.55]KAF1923746.1 hypothetical protein M421DRAFT_304820 [Didymella exigua CBS 183.55]